MRNPIAIRRLKPKRQLLRNRSHLAIGKTGTGKTTLVLNLLHQMPYLDYGLVLAPTHSAYIDYCQVMPHAVVHENTDMTPIVNMLKTQKDILRGRGNRKIRYLYVILDDCMADDAVMKHKVMKDVAFNGRHYMLTTIFTTQYIMEVPKKIRANINYVYQLREMNGDNIVLLHKMYFSVLGDRKTFEAILHGNTSKRDCLFFDNVTSNTSPSGCVFFYKGQRTSELGDFQVGCKSMYRIIARYLVSQTGKNRENNIMEEAMREMNVVPEPTDLDPAGAPPQQAFVRVENDEDMEGGQDQLPPIAIRIA